MYKTDFSELELKNAFCAYGEAWCAAAPVFDSAHVFSDSFERQKFNILGLGNKQFKRENGMKALKKAVAIIIVILAISGAVLSIPSVYAALRNWTVEIYNKYIDFTFVHSDDDHAVIIAQPGNLPDGFELAENYHNGYYTRSIYEDSEGKTYLQFEYSKPTEVQKQKIERRGKKADEVIFDVGIKAYFVSSESRNRLFWYDEERDLFFNVISNIGKYELLECFPTVSYRLPYYGPEWIPDGYEETGRYDVYPEYIIEYRNKAEDSFIYLTYNDLAEYGGMTAFFGGNEIDYDVIETGTCFYYYASPVKEDSYSDILWFDEEHKLIFSVNAMLDKESLLRFAKSIRCLESDWE